MDDSPVNKCFLTGMLDWKLMVKHIYNILQMLKIRRHITTIMAVACTECSYRGIVLVQLGFSPEVAQVQILCKQRHLGREKTGSCFEYVAWKWCWLLARVYTQKKEEGKDERGKILAEAVVQACRTDILVHIIIKVCPLARLAMYLSLVRFLSLNVDDIVLPLDFVIH